MRKILVIAFMLLLSSVYAQRKKELVKSYERGITEVGYNGSGYSIGVSDNHYLFKINMNREKKVKINIPFSERHKLFELLKKTVDLMEKAKLGDKNINKMVGDLDVNRYKIRFEFEGRGKDYNYSEFVFINVFEKGNKVVYYTMNEFNIRQIMLYLADKKFKKYKRAKKSL